MEIVPRFEFQYPMKNLIKMDQIWRQFILSIKTGQR